MDEARVCVHDVPVGHLVRLNDNEDFEFRFDEAWLADPDRPELGQLFIDRRPDPIASSAIPAWFAHLLPRRGDPWRRHLQRWAGLQLNDDDDFDLLVAMGQDLPGAITVERVATSWTGSAQHLVPLPVPQGAIRFSLAGAQWKLSADKRKSGLTVPATDQAGHYIAKFDMPTYPGVPRLEFVTTEWARLAGVEVHTTELRPLDTFEDLPEGVPCASGFYLLAHRFDRRPGGRVHMEDFAQVLGVRPDDSIYSTSFEVLAAALHLLCDDDVPAFVDRLAFMLVCGNDDAHLKNWSVVYPDRRHPRLSPAYDLISTVAINPAGTLALELGGTKAFSEVTLRHFDRIAALTDRTEAEIEQQVRRARDRALDVWSEQGAHFDLTATERANIDRHASCMARSLR